MRVLIVEDDGPLRERLARALRDRGHSAGTASTGAAARTLAAQGFDGAIVDVRLGVESGLDVVADLLAVQPAARLIVVTGHLTPELSREAARLGVTACLAKPFDADELLAAFDRAR